MFSLTSYINKRKDLLEQSQRGFSREEKRILAQLNTAQVFIQDLNAEETDPDDYVNADKSFDKVYFEAREHYISLSPSSHET